MAIVKAPLFSFEARGQVAKSIVFFPWKGINAVRKHVTPTNPNSTAQQAQRAWITEAVSKIHVAMADATHPINSDDRSAYSLWATVLGITMTWFNTLSRMWIKARVATDSACIFSGAVLTPASGQVTVQMFITSSIGAEPTTGSIKYGSSPNALLSSHVTTVIELAAGHVITGLTNGTIYYFQYTPSTAGYTTSKSGIYHSTPHA